MSGMVKQKTVQSMNWRETECRFDIPLQELTQTHGERLVDHLPEIEDTKGNNGLIGRLIVTNLRIIWIRRPQKGKTKSVNISIGLGTVLMLTINTVNSRLRGKTRSLVVQAKMKNVKYQFIFTNLVPNTPRLFTTIQAIHRAYDTTRIYREVRLRSAIVLESQLVLLPQEEICDEIDGVWNLAQEQGQLGKMFVTNIRIVWFSKSNEMFNISVPYYKVLQVSLKDTSYGKTTVVKCTKLGGGHSLGFRIDPPERGVKVVHQIGSLMNVFQVSPIFGIDVQQEEAPPPLTELVVDSVEDDVEIEATSGDAFAAYFADAGRRIMHSGEGGGGGDDDGPVLSERKPVFNEDIGLAVEELRPGTTMQSLWSAQ